ncbi:bifunctional diaminohydroxyphosphoribosylaminopyrimidine deaminase/5-amino-6-(5-phosphoribosylamino)uracil reductase RibD [Dysgonomonas sp.]
MIIDEKYMQRCLQLALNGKGFVNPNPMVGAVVVHRGKIIGEGYHRRYGEAHAEVNAIDSVRDKSLLKESTIYVSLEPCSHYGKTPPCAQLIINMGIPRVVVGCLDPYPAVSGGGIKMLQAAGVDVTVGVLEKEARRLNKEFFVAQTYDRPYIYLKWAQTNDGYIDRVRLDGERPSPTPISNDFCRMLVHKKRAEVGGIMIGTNTAVNDNPSLTTRCWHGRNPVRIILDRMGRIPAGYTVFDGKVETIVFTEQKMVRPFVENLTFIKVDFEEGLVENILSILKKRKINSVLVEGGRELLQSLIDKHLWDEAYIEISHASFGDGVKAPIITGRTIKEWKWGTSRQIQLCSDNYKIL